MYSTWVERGIYGRRGGKNGVVTTDNLVDAAGNIIESRGDRGNVKRSEPMPIHNKNYGRTQLSPSERGFLCRWGKRRSRRSTFSTKQPVPLFYNGHYALD